MTARQKNGLILLAVVLAGLVALAPFRDFQPSFTPGDNGRDLYCFQKTLEGQMPYRDYWWVYGPLMPYYYALFFGIFGVTAKSILLGKLALVLASGVLIFFILRPAAGSFAAFVGALWFWTFNPRFTYTYNHIGGVAGVLGVLLFLSVYQRKPKPIYLTAGFVVLFLTGLIKANIAAASCAAFVISAVLIDVVKKDPVRRYNWPVLLAGPAALLTGLAAVYAVFLRGLPLYAVRQCLPFLAADRATHTPLLVSLERLVRMNLGHFFPLGPNAVFGLIILIAAGRIVHEWRTAPRGAPAPEDVILWLAVPALFWVFNLHEYLLSGVPYRLFWVTPLQVLLVFLVLGLGVRTLAVPLKNVLYLVLLAIVVLAQVSLRVYVHPFKVPQQFLANPRMQIYVSNPKPWLDTVRGVEAYLEKNLRKDQTFLALPYEPLYYYLAGKDSPTRQLFLAEYIDIPPQQEERIILDMEWNNAALVLISNRAHADVPDMGTFGRDYGKTLAGFIAENYALDRTFGNWDVPGGTFGDHAVKVLKRK